MKDYLISLCLLWIAFCLNDLRANDLVTPHSLRFAVISDMNKSYGDTTYLQDLDDTINFIVNSLQEPNPIDLVLSTGDMVAGQKKGLDYQKMWNSFHRHVTIPLNDNGIMFAPSPGNHDASILTTYSQERQYYQKTFHETITDSLIGKTHLLQGSKFPFYYAFLYKGGLFISLDATSTSPLGTAQMNWLKTTLAQNQNVLFKIVFGHVPLLPFAFGRAHEYLGKENPKGILEFEKLLESYKVDYFLSGHHHVYYPGHRNGHVQYISIPLLGTGTRALLGKGQYPSARGFLVFEFVSGQGLKWKAIESETMTPFQDSKLPSAINIPKTSSSTCIDCNIFPQILFIPQTDRSLFLKSHQGAEKKAFSSFLN